MIRWMLLGAFAILALWVAWRIGRMVLRMAAGLAFLALAGALIWYIFLRRP